MEQSRQNAFITEAILPTKVGYGDGYSILISDFLTDNDYENIGKNYILSKDRTYRTIDVKVSDINFKVPAGKFKKGYSVMIQKGKKNFIKVNFV